jgi:hypothetical protein
VLEKLAIVYKQFANSRVASGQPPASNVIWNSDNSVTLEAVYSLNPSLPDSYTGMVFATTQDATNYLNGLIRAITA